MDCEMKKLLILLLLQGVNIVLGAAEITPATFSIKNNSINLIFLANGREAINTPISPKDLLETLASGNQSVPMSSDNRAVYVPIDRKNLCETLHKAIPNFSGKNIYDLNSCITNPQATQKADFKGSIMPGWNNEISKGFIIFGEESDYLICDDPDLTVKQEINTAITERKPFLLSIKSLTDSAILLTILINKFPEIEQQKPTLIDCDDDCFNFDDVKPKKLSSYIQTTSAYLTTPFLKNIIIYILFPFAIGFATMACYQNHFKISEFLTSFYYMKKIPIS